ncbi:MAG: hypothetical protein GF313_13460 [Caldithrix sp.]|nr:hypothetical protein [Caldithrix sp.]
MNIGLYIRSTYTEGSLVRFINNHFDQVHYSFTRSVEGLLNSSSQMRPHVLIIEAEFLSQKEREMIRSRVSKDRGEKVIGINHFLKTSRLNDFQLEGFDYVLEIPEDNEKLIDILQSIEPKNHQGNAGNSAFIDGKRYHE